MKKYILSIILMLCAASLPVVAQDAALGDDAAFENYVTQLRTQGNEYYLLSNRMATREVARQLADAIARRKAAGKLTDSQAEAWMQDVWKLWGDYHYDNADYEPASYDSARHYFERYRDYYLQHSDDYRAGQGLYVALRELAQLEYKLGHYQQALANIEEALQRAANYNLTDDEYLDVQSQLAICLARNSRYDEALKEIDEVVANYEGKDTEHYGEALRKKAKILMLRQEAQNGTMATDVLSCYKQYFDLKKKDALQHFAGMASGEREQYWMRIRPFVTDCYRLEDTDAAFLYDVALFSKGLLLQLNRDGGGTQALNVTWQQIQQQLPQDGCAIEFIQYEKGGLQQMGALVLGKTGSPRFVSMPTPEDVMKYEIGPRTIKERLYSTDGSKKNSLYNDSTGFFRIIWHDALRQEVGSARTIYFAPDGYIHQMAIEYMLPEECAAWRMFRLTSTRRLMQRRQTTPAGKALVLGGVRYESNPQHEASDNDTQAYRYLQEKRIRFKYLDKSASECDSIIICRQNKGDKLLLGQEATEQQFRQLCSQYPIIHISTHGVFGAAQVPQGTDLKPCLTDGSLSESILALAGLQSTLDSQTFNPQQQDGVLSAKEISALDLSRVELVVLACCETALGYVTADGVYGIQRGLKNAGAGVIIATLWDVNDEATTHFMIALHEQLGKGQTIGAAFRAARSSLTGFYAEPQYRDPFILIDALE